MKSTLTKSDFINGFHGSYKENFSYEAREALFEYFEELESDTGEELEFDPVSICCEWAEYDTLKDALSEYGDDIKTLEDLQDSTQVIEMQNGNILIISF
tara:strand:- start:137 stop:433 length:297 start_codon:yes stop_codon:yes gene_type:complete